MESQEYLEGRIAYYKGTPIEENPYGPKEDWNGSYADWNRGWRTAKIEDTADTTPHCDRASPKETT